MAIAPIIVQASGNPDGVFLARFLDVAAWENDNEYGPALKWRWVVIAGPHNGTEISLITTAKCTPKNKCGAILAGLVGRAIQPSEPIDPSQFIGKSYTVVVQGGKITGISPPPQQ